MRSEAEDGCRKGSLVGVAEEQVAVEAANADLAGRRMHDFDAMLD